jgi:hypothetical protein
LLRETGSRFSVDMTAATAYAVWTGVHTSPQATSCTSVPFSPRVAQWSAQTIAINGRICNNLSVYNIGDYTISSSASWARR